MADPKRRLPGNVAGEFYVDASCINCGTCGKFATAVFDYKDDHAYVARQPATSAEETEALRAVVACPVGAIGSGGHKVPQAVRDSFPLPIGEEGIFVNGYNAESSYGSDSYLIRDPRGNWLIDSPRISPLLVKRFTELGGIKYIFLTHRDDVADAAKYAREFGATRIIHRAELSAQPDAEIVLDDAGARFDDAEIIWTPGHTRGHAVLLWKEKYLFTGDHLPWSRAEHALRPSRRNCWYAWPEQARSVEKLGGLAGVEWVLPGHGERRRFAPGAFAGAVTECAAWMRRL